MKRRAPLLFVLWTLLFARYAGAQDLGSSFYEIGTPGVTDYYVDPSSGFDTNNGLSRSTAKRSVTEIWNALPQNTTLTTGVRINLLPGTYGANHLPNYWENRIGTQNAPIILQAADGFGTVLFSRDINMAGTKYFYLLGVEIKNELSDGYGDAFHCERCEHVLLRGNSFNGAPDGRASGRDVAHETIKFNQSQYIYIENNNIQGADDNGIDWVAVQYGHILGNRIHDTEGWCAYVKGGSSYILIESNIAYDCGEGGITAGQGTGFEFMVSPWLRFEANYIKIVNNIVHDIEGAAFGVNGGYAVLVAHNSAFRIGARSHLVEVVFGERSCDGESTECAARQALGGWGPAAPGGEAQPIGDKDVIIANNIFYNPSGYQSGSQHFAIYGPRTPSVGGIPSPQRTDTGLKITGNLVWNGDFSMPLGIEESDQGCQNTNPTCNATQIAADNLVNTIEPDFISPATGDLRPQAGGALEAMSAGTIPAHVALDSALNPIPEGISENTSVREFSGAALTTRPPGAIAASTSSVNFPSSGGVSTPGGGSSGGPSITFKKATARKHGKKITVNLSVAATDSDGLGTVNAELRTSTASLTSITLRLKKGRYSGKAKFTTKSKNITAVITASDTLGNTRSVSRGIKVKK